MFEEKKMVSETLLQAFKKTTNKIQSIFYFPNNIFQYIP